MIDVVYLTWNRHAYTARTWQALVANTDWSLVHSLRVYDDGSKDGTLRFLKQRLLDVPVPTTLVETTFKSPVRTMLHYLAHSGADFFAKLDNDIMVPPGWLERLASVMERNPGLDLLGMEAGMANGCTGFPWPPADPLALTPDAYTWVESSHIGGVGLMRVQAFRDRPALEPAGRFGFTEWQHLHQPVRGWIAPDLLSCDLSRVPVGPWPQLSWEYRLNAWERPWGTWDDMPSMYYDWWQEAA